MRRQVSYVNMLPPIVPNRIDFFSNESPITSNDNTQTDARVVVVRNVTTFIDRKLTDLQRTWA